MPVHVVYQPNPFRRSSRSVSEHATPCTVRDCAPDTADLVAFLNGERVDDWTKECEDGDYLSFGPRVGEPGSLGLALTQALTLLVGTTLVFRNIIAGLFGGRRKPARTAVDDSVTYGFQQIESNPDHNGAALPVVYGRHQVAGFTGNIYTRTGTSPPDTYLYVLYVLAGHECYAVGDKTADGGPFTSEDDNLPEGLRINGQPAGSFRDIECYVRLGSADQDIIPNLQYPRQQTVVDRVLEVSSDPTSVEVTPGTYAATDTEIAQWDTFVTHEMDDVGDDFIAELRFPGGLFSTNASAGVTSATVQVQARYVRLDARGNVYGDYVVLPTFPDITLTRTQATAVEVGATFLDPVGYTVPSGGEYLELDGVNDYASDTTVSGIASMAAADTEMTAIAWVRLDWNVASGTGTYNDPYIMALSNSSNAIVAQYDSGNPQGFRLWIDDVGTSHGTYDIGNSKVTTDSWVIRVRLGDGTSSQLFNFFPNAFFVQKLFPESVSGTGTVAGRWGLVAFSYKAGEGVRFFVNDSQLGGTQAASSSPLWEEAGSIFVGSIDATPTNPFAGDIDELLLYQRAFTIGDVRQKWNGGSGNPGITSETSIVAGWHFDSDGTDFIGSNDLTLNNGAAVSSSSDGPVSASAVGTPRRDRYRIDFQRVNNALQSQFGSDEAVLDNVKTTVYEAQNYAGWTLLGLRIRASTQLSGRRPLITQEVMGALCPVWDGADEIHPNTPATWTQNAAWIMADWALNETYGLGQFFSKADLDWLALREGASYFSEKVFDGETRPNDSDPPHIFNIDVEPNSVAGGDWPKGRLLIGIPAAEYPGTWPQTTTTTGVVSPTEPGWDHHVLLDLSNDASHPAWLDEYEGRVYRVGEVLFQQSIDVFFVSVHLDRDPASVQDSYAPMGGDYITCARYESRFQFDGVFDRTDFGAWDALILILSTARSVPILRGSQLSISVDRPRSPSALISMGNTSELSFENAWSGSQNRPNHIVAEILNRDLHYGQDFVEDEHSSLNDPTVFEAFRSEPIRLEGIVRETQARRHIRQDLNFYNLIRQLGAFEVDLDAIGYEIGDAVWVSHDLPQWGFSGRIFNDSPATTVVYLDRAVTIEAATNYQVQVRDSSTGIIETANVDETATGGAGTYEAGSRIVLTAGFFFAPAKGDLYSWGQTTKVSNQFVIVDTELDPRTLRRRVRVIEYDPNVYESGFSERPASISALPAPATS